MRIVRQPVWLLLMAGAAIVPALPLTASDEASAASVFHQDVAWSPDGNGLAFSELAFDGEYRPENWSVYVAAADGSGRRLVASNASRVTWSPDGDRLAFGSSRRGNWDIYTARIDGSGLARLTDDDANDSAPAWSPSGDRIAFASDRDGNSEIYVMSRDGSRPLRMTHNPAPDHDPSWSPDGRELVFYREIGQGSDRVFVVEVESGEELNITNDTNRNIFPAFRWDGRIGFTVQREGSEVRRIVHVAADGSDRTELRLEGAFFARWSPDGGALALIRGTWPESSIFVARADGRNGVEVIGASPREELGHPLGDTPVGRNLIALKGLFKALNQHDVDAQFAHYAEEMAYVEEGRSLLPDREAERHDREFEAENDAVWTYTIVNSGPDSVEAIVREDMKFYQLLGVGARSHRARYRFRHGKIAELRTWCWAQEAAPYRETRNRFVSWLVRERPDEANLLMHEGRLTFTGESARLINSLVREWKTTTARDLAATRDLRDGMSSPVTTLGGLEWFATGAPMTGAAQWLATS